MELSAGHHTLHVPLCYEASARAPPPPSSSCRLLPWPCQASAMQDPAGSAAPRPTVAPSRRHDSTRMVRSRLNITRHRDGTGLVRADTSLWNDDHESGFTIHMGVCTMDGSLRVGRKRAQSGCTGMTNVWWANTNGRRVSMAFGHHVALGGARHDPILELNLLIESELPADDEENSRSKRDPERSEPCVERDCSSAE